MRQTRHGVLPRALVLGLGLCSFAGVPDAAARTVDITNHAALVKHLLRPAATGTRYRFSKVLVARGEVDAQWLRVRNRALLRQLSWVRTLSLQRSTVPSFGFLKHLPKLERLDLSRTRIGSAAPLAGLAKLQELDLSDTPIRSLRPLTKLRDLAVLDLSGTRVTDLSPLRGRHLDRLTLGRPGQKTLPDLRPLASIGRLTLRHLGAAPDLSGLNRARIRALILDGTGIRKLGRLRSNTTIQRLSLRNTKVPVTEVRALLRKAPGMTVIMPRGRTVGRVLVWIKVAPSPTDYPCLIGAGECTRETFGPQRRPSYKFVMP